MLFNKSKFFKNGFKKKSAQKPDLMKGVFILLFCASITAFFFNNISPHGIPLYGQWNPQDGVVSASLKTSDPEHSMEIQSSKQVTDIIQAGQRIIIDVRPKDLFDLGHIPTALSFPLNEFNERLPEITRRIHRFDPVLLYCSSVYCTDSHTFADYLTGMGYKDVKIFSGGFRQWQDEGNKIETQEK
jgi:rhodanese-related sulfurtransferase